MSNVKVVEFSNAIDSAIMEKGDKGIHHVVTQYMFGQQKFLIGLLKKDTDEARISVVNEVVDGIKKAYRSCGVSGVENYVSTLSTRANGLESL